jgi:hypothetical protein
MRLAAKRIQFACNWWPLGYNLNMTGRQLHAIFAHANGQYSAKLLVILKACCPNNYFGLKIMKSFEN